MDKIVTYCSSSGISTIDIDRLVKKWNYLFWIAEYDGEFRLIKYKRKDSPIVQIKVQISDVQKEEIINRLNLKRYPDSVFRKAASWK